MLKLYRNKEQSFECKVKVEGADFSNAKARLIISDKEMNHIFEGTVDSSGNCIIDIPPLDKVGNRHGNAILEVIVGGGLFTPLKTTYQIIEQVVEVSDVIVVDKIKKGHGIFTKNAKTSERREVKEMLEKFNHLKKEHKKVLREYVELDYKPHKNTLKWAKRIFNNPKSIQAKMCMYQKENIIGVDLTK